MEHLSDLDLLIGFEEAGLAQCPKCGSFYKIDDDGCDCGEEEIEIAA